jgi:hypothetical protein
MKKHCLLGCVHTGVVDVIFVGENAKDSSLISTCLGGDTTLHFGTQHNNIKHNTQHNAAQHNDTGY